MGKELIYTNKALKGLKIMPKKQAVKMTVSLKEIAADNTAGLDIRKLHGMDGFRLRIGQFRAVYTNDMVVMTVENIGPRGSIYKRK